MAKTMTEILEFHNHLKHQVAMHCRNTHTRIMQEVCLPSGRIADIVAITPTDEIHIIEVKTTIVASLMDQAIKKYNNFCHRLYIAFPESDYQKLDTRNAMTDWLSPTSQLGILLITNTTVLNFRESKFQNLPSNVIEYLLSQFRRIPDYKAPPGPSRPLPAPASGV